MNPPLTLIIEEQQNNDRYFSDKTNLFDWIVILLSLFSIFSPAKIREHESFTAFTLFLMIMIYYRCFNYFNVFDSFRSLVGIINIILVKIIPFFSIVVFFYVLVAILMIHIQKENSEKEHFRDVYYWVFFGGIDGDTFDPKFSFIAVIFGTLFIGIVLLNILIAYLSNVFSALEEQQQRDSLTGMAMLCLDVECVISMFKKLFSRKYKSSFYNRHNDYFRCMYGFEKGEFGSSFNPYGSQKRQLHMIEFYRKVCGIIMK